MGELPITNPKSKIECPMQENLQNTAQKSQLLEKVEIASVVGSIGGAIVSIFVNQVAVAAIPLSVTVALNLANRRMLLESMKQNNYAAIASVIQNSSQTQTKLDFLAEQQASFEQQTDNKHTELQGGFSLLDAQLQQLTNNFSFERDTFNQAIAQLQQQDSQTGANLQTLHEQLEKLQQQTVKVELDREGRRFDLRESRRTQHGVYTGPDLAETAWWRLRDHGRSRPGRAPE